MPLDTSVKVFHSRMAGISTFAIAGSEGVAGYVANIGRPSLFSFIDKIFVNGFNSKAVLSMTVTSNVATVVFLEAHGFEDLSVVAISGAATSSLNGEKRITYVNAVSFTFQAEGVADGAISGTISAKYAPLGWSFIGSPTTAPVTVRSSDVTGTQCAVTFDTSGGTGFSLTGYRSSSPSAALNSFGVRYIPAQMANYGSGPYYIVYTHWVLIGDGKTFYLLSNYIRDQIHNGTADNYTGIITGFGNFNSLASPDLFSTFLCATTAANYASGSFDPLGSLGYSSNTASIILAGTSGGGATATCHSGIEFPVETASYLGTQSSSVLAGTGYPNSTDSSLILCRRAIGDGSLRGYLRGLYQSPQACGSSFNTLDRVSGQGVLAGRKLLALKNGAAGSTTGTGVTFFDITGPWA